MWNASIFEDGILPLNKVVPYAWLAVWNPFDLAGFGQGRREAFEGSRAVSQGNAADKMHDRGFGIFRGGHDCESANEGWNTYLHQ